MKSILGFVSEMLFVFSHFFENLYLVGMVSWYNHNKFCWYNHNKFIVAKTIFVWYAKKFEKRISRIFTESKKYDKVIVANNNNCIVVRGSS